MKYFLIVLLIVLCAFKEKEIDLTKDVPDFKIKIIHGTAPELSFENSKRVTDLGVFLGAHDAEYDFIEVKTYSSKFSESEKEKISRSIVLKLILQMVDKDKIEDKEFGKSKTNYSIIELYKVTNKSEFKKYLKKHKFIE